jgi:hypothetical protein
MQRYHSFTLRLSLYHNWNSSSVRTRHDSGEVRPITCSIRKESCIRQRVKLPILHLKCRTVFVCSQSTFTDVGRNIHGCKSEQNDFGSSSSCSYNKISCVILRLIPLKHALNVPRLNEIPRLYALPARGASSTAYIDTSNCHRKFAAAHKSSSWDS